MTDLEKLLGQIEEESSQKVRKLIEETQQQVKVIEMQGETERNDIKMKAKIALEKERISVLQRAESAALLHEKKIILQGKYEMIEALLQKARASLNVLDEEDYFKVLHQLVKKYAKESSGTILFTSKDYDRLPEWFMEALETLQLKIGKCERELEGGFILKQGDVEENCSFDALFLEKKEVLQDEVGRYLFG
ncbi:MAG: V-type ATP synthase subunit E [Cellulosilyticaceae bacterium]